MQKKSCAFPPAQMKKIKNFTCSSVFTMHLYSKLHVNQLRNKDMEAENLFLRISASTNERKNLYHSCPPMIHLKYYIEISIIIRFLIRELLHQSYFAQLNTFVPIRKSISAKFLQVSTCIYFPYMR